MQTVAYTKEILLMDKNMEKENTLTLLTKVSMKVDGEMIKCMDMAIYNTRMIYMTDNLKRMKKVGLEYSTLAVEIVTLVNTKVINSWVKESMYGQMKLFILAILKIIIAIILENGFHLVLLLKYILDSTQKVRNMEVENTFGAMDVFMMEISIMI